MRSVPASVSTVERSHSIRVSCETPRNCASLFVSGTLPSMAPSVEPDETSAVMPRMVAKNSAPCQLRIRRALPSSVDTSTMLASNAKFPGVS